MDFNLQEAASSLQSFLPWIMLHPDDAIIVGLLMAALTFVSFALPQSLLSKMASKDPTHFISDVLVRPSIGPAAGVLLGALIGLVVWLTIQYAPGAAAREALNNNADPSGLISVSAGFWAIGIVSALSIAFGLEPILGPRINRWLVRQRHWLTPGQRFGFLPRTAAEKVGNVVTRLPITVVWLIGLFFVQIAFLLWRSPSFFLSLLDFILARPLAIFAGAKFRPWWVRYGILLFWVLGGAWFAWNQPAPTGVWGAVVGIIAIVSVVRRWNWIERDRDAFLAARGLDPTVTRIGFAEDLRDEALIGIVFLFFLIPLAFRQIDLGYDAFALADGAIMPEDPINQFLTWLGFFGAELAKAVPLVDWSEVFHVANGSPIKSNTALGAQIVFVMRASLDLVLISAVLQAAQIAARVRDQRSAFKANRLPILDPFSERATFIALAASMFKRPFVKTTAQPAVSTFPNYDISRLVVIAAGKRASPQSDEPILHQLDARRAAMAVLSKQCAKQNHEPSDSLLADRLLDETEDISYRLFALNLLVEGGASRAGKSLEAVLVRDVGKRTKLRAEAARQLGSLRYRPAADALFARLIDHHENIAVRAQAGLSLAKIADPRAPKALTALCPLFSVGATEAELIPVMTTAYALALDPFDRPKTPDELVSLFAKELQPYARRAVASARGDHEAMANIPAGSFRMGAAPGEDAALNFEAPQHQVEVSGFELGKFEVTFDEYDGFCKATGRDLPDDGEWGRGRRPVINVSWHDAHDYCDWLYEFTGERFRLPSEAEWEYACRAGTTTPFATGETITTEQANFDGNYVYGRGVTGKFEQKTLPVGSFPENGFGLFDMQGNVWEWCQDAWNGTYNLTHEPETERPDNGAPWVAGDVSLRVLRGGSWYVDPRGLRSATRIRVPAGFRYFEVGFRLARTLLPH